MELENLVGQKELGQLAKKLVSSVTKAIGTLYEPVHIKRLAKANAEASLIEARKEIEITDIEHRAYSRLIEKETRRQRNIENIVAKAITVSSGNGSSNDEVDEDWIIDFFENSQDCSSELLQSVWAKLLVNEVDKPGSFSRRTLSAIKLIDAEEAKLFTLFCGCIWTMNNAVLGQSKVLFMDMDQEGRYSDDTWGFDGTDVTVLEHLGLARHEYFELDIKREYILDFYGNSHALKSITNSEHVEYVSLTKVGEELFKVCGAVGNIEYYKHTLGYFEGLGVLKDQN